MSSQPSGNDMDTRDGEILADLFDTLLQEILEGRTPDLLQYLPDREDLRDRVSKTWALACSVAGRREPSRPVLGGYEILRELGHGGMGTVYLARHQILQREVAIKVLPHSLAMSPRAKQRFIEEAKALARIRHAHVVPIHRILDHSEMLAFEMEFIDGKSLQKLIQDLRERPRPISTADLAEQLGVSKQALGTHSPVEWFVRVCIMVGRALAEVHRHGLVHRDVKPANILLRKDGTPVLADFGLARLSDLEATQTGAFAGTPVYAAPERLRGGDANVDARTDVYSLGVTLYELLTLSPPFAGSSTHEVLRRIEGGRLHSLRHKAPHVSRDLATVVQRAMEPDPRHRYATPDEFADDLERLLNLEPIRARPAGPLRRVAKFARRHHRLAIAALCGAVLVALAIWPFVAHAQAQEDARQRAAELLLEARTMLLSPESLHVAWTRSLASTTHQPLRDPSARRTHLAALETVVAAYDSALAIAPLDSARLERDAVAAALAIQRQSGDQPAAETIARLPALLAATARANSSAAPVADLRAAIGAASTEECLSAGLLAFLLGNSSLSHATWQGLQSELPGHPLLEACQALQLAGDGYPERAYPRLFHSTRAFPDASVLAIAMADAALVMGDTDLAAQWLKKAPDRADKPFTHTRRRLLEADLMAATGETDGAAHIYRELAHLDFSDILPVLRLANLALSRGDGTAARRALQEILSRWPDQAAARLQLAQLELQQRNLRGYLTQMRYVLAQDLSRLPRSTGNHLIEILRLGGFATLAGDAALAQFQRPARHGIALPLSYWLPPGACTALHNTLQVTAIWDRCLDSASRNDARPIGAALRAMWLCAMRMPRLTSALPTSAQVAVLGGIPLVLGSPTDLATSLTLPFQRILGNPATIAKPHIVVPYHPEPPRLDYAAHCLLAGDLDGDTLDDVCIANPAPPELSSQARVDLLALADGSLLRTLSSPDETLRFGAGLAILGDIDGDRCNDLLVGSPSQVTSDHGSGVVELYSGRTGKRIWRSTGHDPGFGSAVATLTDLDGDAVLDFVVGAPRTNPSKTPGRAFVCSGATGQVIRELTVDQTGVSFGTVVASAGDVDADGTGDVLVTGNAGGTRGLAAVLSGRDATVLATFAEDSTQTDFGYRAIGLGDINGDGHADFAISAPAFTGRARQNGKVDVISGKTGKLLYFVHGERPGEAFGMALCALPHWRADGQKALAVSAMSGGPAGTGYVRVFDAKTGAPLQTFATHPRVRLLGASLADLGDRDGDGLRDLGVPLIHRDGRCAFWSVSFAMLQQR